MPTESKMAGIFHVAINHSIFIRFRHVNTFLKLFANVFHNFFKLQSLFSNCRCICISFLPIFTNNFFLETPSDYLSGKNIVKHDFSSWPTYTVLRYAKMAEIRMKLVEYLFDPWLIINSVAIKNLSHITCERAKIFYS
jgi:hypothetical protein